MMLKSGLTALILNENCVNDRKAVDGISELGQHNILFITYNVNR